MRGLEAGLTVKDIAVFGLSTCGGDETIDGVRLRVDAYDFDNVPVREGDIDNGPIVGMVEEIKTHPRDALVGDVMKPLAESMLIAGDVPLVHLLPNIPDREYRLVLEGSRVMGVVTPSDVVQLPVRLLVFALLIHLEETMSNVIRAHTNDDQNEILDALPPDRRARVQRLLKKHAESGLNPSPVDAMYFGDKAVLMFDLGVVPDIPVDRKLFDDFRELRNRVDHALEYAETREKLESFIEHVQQMETWIARLTGLLPEEALALPGEA
jgi:hypothetical protein